MLQLVYWFSHGIMTVTVNLIKLIWMLGAGVAKLATGSKKKRLKRVM